MINWKRVDYAIFNHNLHHYDLENDCAYNADETLTTAHNDRAILIDAVNQFRPRPFDPDDRMTWPEMETEVLVRFDFGWKIAKLCYTAITKGPIWKTDKERWDYTAGIEWKPLPPVGKESK